MRKRIAALRGDCELIKMTDFIDTFDYNSHRNCAAMLCVMKRLWSKMDPRFFSRGCGIRMKS